MYDALISWENLLLAYKKASRRKRGRSATAIFEHRLESNILHIQRELVAGVYEPGTYNSFFIHEPKRRLISAAPFKDRVVHHALCNIIEPVFERLFIPNSFANRVGKGTHRALQQVERYSKRYSFFMHCDLRQFFPSIDHHILKNILSERITDESVMELISKILESGKDVLTSQYDMVYFAGDDLFAVHRPRGLPIGNLTSQFWANVYMNPFDHFVKRELSCRAYLRYVDDFVLFSDNMSLLWQWKAAIEERLARYRLTLHQGIHPRPVTEGIPFLGFVSFPGERRLKRRKGIRYRRKLSRMIEREVVKEKIQASVQGWVNHVRYGNTVGLQKSILDDVREKLGGNV